MRTGASDGYLLPMNAVEIEEAVSELVAAPFDARELAHAFSSYKGVSKALDYVSAWFLKAGHYGDHSRSSYAFVTTNSLWQGQQVGTLWPILNDIGLSITFAEPSFKWTNLASHNAGVIVSVVGLSASPTKFPRLYAEGGALNLRFVDSINAYLVAGPNVVVDPSLRPLNGLSPMMYGNQPRDGGNLCLSIDELRHLESIAPEALRWGKRYMGSIEMINGGVRGCLWIPENDANFAWTVPFTRDRLSKVRQMRSESSAPSTRGFADRAHRFVQIQGVAERKTIAVAKVSSERRAYLPADLVDERTIISNLLFGIYDAPLWNFAFVVSRLHLVWVGTVCGKMKNDFRYSNTLGWNTFPVPKLTEQDKLDLTSTAENILLAREAHFPATIANLYDPEAMPDDLRRAHEDNDEVLERIYIGRRFRNDTERLEKLFELYTKMTANAAPKGKVPKKANKAA